VHILNSFVVQEYSILQAGVKRNF